MMQERLRVGFITQWFPPEPVTNPVWIARALRRRGLQVGVLTGIPNYPTGRVQAPYSATRRYVESVEGFPVVRAPLYPSHSRSGVRRGINYLTFAASASLTGRRLLGAADVNLVYGSPATAAIPALMARIESRTPFILYVQDLWPDSVKETGLLRVGRLPDAAIDVIEKVVDRTYHYASHIAVIAEGMKVALVNRGVVENKISVIHNWAESGFPTDPSEVARIRMRFGVGEDEILCMYAGNHGEAQKLDAWIDAIRACPEYLPLKFVFVGGGSQREHIIQRASGIPGERLQFHPQITPEDVPSWLSASDLQIISLADTPLFRMTIPGKVQASLAAGKAVVASVRGDAAELLRASGAAFIAVPEDSVSIIDALMKASNTGRAGLERLGARGKAFYQENMSEEVCSQRLYEELVRTAAERAR